MNISSRINARLLCLLCVSLLAFSCSGNQPNTQPSPTPTPDPKTRAARAELEFQGDPHPDIPKVETLTNARDAVAQFVRSALPGWTLKGIASQPSFDQNAFVMDAEIEKRDQRVVISFDVQKFFSDSGDGYWRAVPMNQCRGDRVHSLNDDTLRKQLFGVQTQLAEPSPEE